MFPIQMKMEVWISIKYFDFLNRQLNFESQPHLDTNKIIEHLSNRHNSLKPLPDP